MASTMSATDQPNATSTDFSFINTLLTFGEEYEPNVGDTILIEHSDFQTKESHPDSGKALVLKADEESLLLRSTDGQEFRVSTTNGYFYVVESQHIQEVVVEQQYRPNPDGVAFSDSCVPEELATRLRADIQSLADQVPIDYHPGSGTKVRDLVHPSLYPYVAGQSKVIGSLPDNPTPEYDRFGRKFESSKYQWLPTPFRIAEDGSTIIDGYINNLDQKKYASLYDGVAQLFSLVLPMVESVLGYVDATQLYHEGMDEHEGDLPEDPDFNPIPITPIPMRSRELQVITKIVDYRLTAGETHEGVWHVEGMSHEHIVATCVYVLERDDSLQGGELLFKRAYTLEEGGKLFWSINQCRPRALEAIIEEGSVPIGKVATPAGRVLVFPNSHIHYLTKLKVDAGATEGHRRVIVFWIVDPDVRIVSTREVPLQQGIISYDDALTIRLKLMEERKRHKETFNLRAVSLCEH